MMDVICEGYSPQGWGTLIFSKYIRNIGCAGFVWFKILNFNIIIYFGGGGGGVQKNDHFFSVDIV